MTVSILHGDVREVLATLPDASFDCIVTDPPYGETSLAWDRWPEGWPALVRRVLKPTGSMWVFGSFRMFMDRRDEFNDWRISHEIVWEIELNPEYIEIARRRIEGDAPLFAEVSA